MLHQAPGHLVWGTTRHPAPAHTARARPVLHTPVSVHEDAPTNGPHADSLRVPWEYLALPTLRPAHLAARVHQHHRHQRRQMCIGTAHPGGTSQASSVLPGVPKGAATSAAPPPANRSHPVAERHTATSSAQTARHTPPPVHQAYPQCSSHTPTSTSDSPFHRPPEPEPLATLRAPIERQR